MSTIDVSVIIPTYRREQQVCEAVQSALSQQGVSVECIVLDDSPDASARQAINALQDPRITYVARTTPSNGRPAVARNEGAAIAKGRYLHFLDDDDHLCEGALHDVVTALDARPNVGVAVGWVVPFGDDPYWLKDKVDYFQKAAKVGAQTPSSLWVTAHILFRGTLMVNSACVMRRSCFAQLGGFDAGIPVYEDVDLWMRGIRRFGHIYVSRPVLHYRVGQPSLMHNLGKKPEKDVLSSNAIIHAKYIKERGQLEYRTLQLLTKFLPFGLIRHIPLGFR